LYSSNGITWSKATGNPFGEGFIRSVSYAAGKFIAVGFGRGSNNIWYSSNGIAWTVASGNPFGAGSSDSVSYAAKKFVAVGFSSAGLIWYSTNGTAWKKAQ